MIKNYYHYLRKISVKCSNIINSTLKKSNYKNFKIFNFKIENLQKGFKRKNLNYKKVGDNYCNVLRGLFI